jgi:SPP1 family predicted phage head-tail adaptor
MRAGEMDKRINIQYPAKSKNSFNEDIVTYTTLSTIWASVEPVTGNERFLQQEKISETTVRFRIRYRSDITTDKQILYKNKKYDILSIINRDDLYRELIVFAKEVI